MFYPLSSWKNLPRALGLVNHKLRYGYAMRHYGVNEKSITQTENTYLLDAYYGALFTDTMLTLFCMDDLRWFTFCQCDYITLQLIILLTLISIRALFVSDLHVAIQLNHWRRRMHLCTSRCEQNGELWVLYRMARRPWLLQAAMGSDIQNHLDNNSMTCAIIHATFVFIDSCAIPLSVCVMVSS